MKRLLLTIIFGALTLCAPMSAIGSSQDNNAPNASKATKGAVAVELQAQAPDTSGDFWVAIHFHLDQGWHLSKELPNNMGSGVKIASEDPHITVGPLLWPSQVTDQVEGDVTLLAKAHVDSKESGTLPLSVQWVACDTQCVPGRATLTLDMAHLDSGTPSMISSALKALPVAAAQLTQSATALSLNESPTSSWLWLLPFAFAGGMLLNLMPCVLPVLSLKVLSLVESAKESTQRRMKLAGGYLLGVMLSFWTLSGLLLGLQASGSQVGWGFQLQEPWCVGLLAGLFFLLSLNLFGLFEWGTSLTQLEGKGNKREGLAAAFWSGILATVVATPCTGPMLGASLGMAMTLPWWQGLMLFSTIGLGMALPFCLLVAIPACVRFLPKPGAWMETMKQAMGFLLLGAVLWLLWVWQAQTGMTAVIWILIGFLTLGVGGWIYGKWGDFTRTKRVRTIARTLGLAAVAAFALCIHEGKSAPAASSTMIENVQHSDWEPYSQDRVEELKASHTPFFIDFTAKWCLICQLNKAPLHSDKVQKLFKDKNVVRLEADWTQSNPEITKALKAFGRSGVPLYVYCDEKGNQSVLPETLSTDLLVKTLDPTIAE